MGGTQGISGGKEWCEEGGWNGGVAETLLGIWDLRWDPHGGSLWRDTVEFRHKHLQLHHRLLKAGLAHTPSEERAWGHVTSWGRCQTRLAAGNSKRKILGGNGNHGGAARWKAIFCESSVGSHIFHRGKWGNGKNGQCSAQYFSHLYSLSITNTGKTSPHGYWKSHWEGPKELKPSNVPPVTSNGLCLTNKNTQLNPSREKPDDKGNICRDEEVTLEVDLE